MRRTVEKRKRQRRPATTADYNPKPWLSGRRHRFSFIASHSVKTPKGFLCNLGIYSCRLGRRHGEESMVRRSTKYKRDLHPDIGETFFVGWRGQS